MEIRIPRIITDRLMALESAGVNVNLTMAIENAVYHLETQHNDQLNGAKAAAKMTLTNREQNIVNKVFSTSLTPREAAELLREVFEMPESIEWCTGYFNVLRHGMRVAKPLVKTAARAHNVSTVTQVQALLSNGPCTPKDIAGILNCSTQRVYCAINQLRKTGMRICMINNEYHVE